MNSEEPRSETTPPSPEPTLAEKFQHLPLMTARQSKWSARTAIPAVVAVAAGFEMLSHFIATEGKIPSEWSFYLAMSAAAGVVVWLVGAPRSDVARPQAAEAKHPDPDVQALIDNRIDIAEYRRRKEEQSAPSAAAERRDA
jgi:hypothetical protein